MSIHAIKEIADVWREVGAYSESNPNPVWITPSSSYFGSKREEKLAYLEISIERGKLVSRKTIKILLFVDGTWKVTR